MNHTYRLVFNRNLHAWIAAPETARGRGQGTRRRKACAGEAQPKGATARQRLLCLTLILTTAFPSSVFALPTGGQVAAGNVATSVSGSQMTLNQGSRAAIMNWQQFNIGAKEAVRIRQGSTDAAMLARVTGGTPSELLGRLQADGKLFLINPKGILVGNGAVIDTGAFLASTLDVSDADFLKGGALTFKGDANAGIVNLGKIVAHEGNVLLLAHTVKNAGEIAAPKGTAGLGAGTEVYLAAPDDATFTIKLNLPASAEQTGVDNSGTIAAAQAELKAAGGSIYDLAVNQSGFVQASGVTNGPDGRVVLTAAGGTVAVSGNVSAHKVDGAGGEILVGGDYRGGNAAVPNAARSLVASTAVLDANASAAVGKGGKIVVWADDATRYFGRLEAKGGRAGGDAGFAEVSGKRSLSFAGSSDLSAPFGKTGTLLLDPTDITIVAGVTNPLPAALSGGTTWAYANDPGAQTLGATSLAGLLLANSVTLQATNSITVNSAVTVGAGGNPNAALTLQSPTIAINSPISLANAASGRLLLLGTAGAGSLTSAAGGTLTAPSLIQVAEFPTVSLSGALSTTKLLATNLTGASTSFVANNAANAVSQLHLSTDEANPQVVGFSGNVNIASNSAMAATALLTATNATLSAAGDLTLQAQSNIATTSTTKLAATGGGVFINQGGANAVGGNGRNRIYTTNTVGAFSLGGLAGYTQVNGVSYPADTQPGTRWVLYNAGIVPTPPMPTLTIAANDFTKLYGQPDPAFTASYSGGTVSDLITLPSFSILQGAHSNVGVYTIVPSGAASSTCNLAYANGTLRINPAPLQIVANSASRTYGAANPAFSAQFVGLTNGDSSNVVSGLQIATAAANGTPVGSYPIVPSGASAANYAISYINGNLTVAPAPLTVAAPNFSRTYGDGALSCTSTMSLCSPSMAQYSGFVNGDTAAKVSGFLMLSTPATAASPGGNYPVVPSGLIAPNYAIKYVNGNLSIVPRVVTVTANDTTSVAGAVPKTFSATAAPPLPVGPQYSVSAVSPMTSVASLFSSTGTYPLYPVVTPAAGTSMAELQRNYQFVLVPGKLKVTTAPVDPMTLNQITTNVVYQDTAPSVMTLNMPITTTVTYWATESTATLNSDGTWTTTNVLVPITTTISIDAAMYTSKVLLDQALMAQKRANQVSLTSTSTDFPTTITNIFTYLPEDGLRAAALDFLAGGIRQVANKDNKLVQLSGMDTFLASHDVSELAPIKDFANGKITAAQLLSLSNPDVLAFLMPSVRLENFAWKLDLNQQNLLNGAVRNITNQIVAKEIVQLEIFKANSYFATIDGGGQGI